MKPMLAGPIVDRKASQAQLDVAVGRVLSDDLWCLSQKLDGHRKAIHIDARQRVTVWAKTGEPADRRLPAAIQAELQRIGGVTPTFDCELVDGKLWLFDLAECPEVGVTHATPLRDRLDVLTLLHNLWTPDPDLVEVLPVSFGADKEDLYVRLQAAGAEGVIAKRVHSPYLPGRRGSNWVKIKFRHDVDCVVTAVGLDGKDNMGLGMYPANGRGKPIDVGECGALTGDGPKVVAAYKAEQRRARPRDVVVTVKILYAEFSDRLYQPTYPLLRTDKRARECRITQLDQCRPNRSVITV